MAGYEALVVTVDGVMSGNREGMADESGRNRVLQRAMRLTQEPFDIMYENPYDAAVATYILALSMSDDSMAREVVKGFSYNRDGWWWAWKLAEYNEYITPIAR